MSHSPSRKGKTYGRQKQGLTFFGRWIDVLNTMCQTDQAEIAKRANISKNVLSRITRGQGDTRRITVLTLLHVYEGIVAERQITMPPGWPQLFFLAWSDDESLIDGARTVLEELEKEEEP